MPKVRHARVFAYSFASIHALYVTKVERKGRTAAELDEVIRWHTAYTQKQLEKQIAAGVDLETFFAQAPALNSRAGADHRRHLRRARGRDRRPPDARDPLHGQIRGRAREGQGDGEDFAGVGVRQIPITASP